MSTIGLDTFTGNYITAALWSSVDDDGTPLDSNHGVEDLAPETLEKMIADCAAFQAECGELLTDDNLVFIRASHAIELAGHDFWLTRNGHGAGFWDGDWKEDVENILTDAAKRFGQVDLYIGDDGRICA